MRLTKDQLRVCANAWDYATKNRVIVEVFGPLQNWDMPGSAVFFSESLTEGWTSRIMRIYPNGSIRFFNKAFKP